ncbi:hypothetical protein KFK09_014470 [Dendrobium nobile]|uniref:BHLH domain-containing protein n=1 Tax=Dendrobium nobile TaxID=94219 RepID=A0A8T3B854_DENNO|nr:hypothetical protein KFK09_014470 [Dendrobium nobile]
MDHFEVDSEVAEALTGFLNDDDPSLHSIDTLFQNDDFVAGYIQQQPPPLLEQQPPPQLFEPNVYPAMAPGCSASPSLSAQSVAARKRRMRISRKTQELARHIPGGIKLSTADMFQSAHKYIMYLEAQLALLELITPSVQECGSRKEDEYLYVLLASPAMQERLAAEGMCLVPLYELP